MYHNPKAKLKMSHKLSEIIDILAGAEQGNLINISFNPNFPKKLNSVINIDLAELNGRRTI